MLMIDPYEWVTLKSSRSTDNGVSFSRIHSGIHSLNSWYGLPRMWEKEIQFLRTSGVFKNFLMLPSKLLLTNVISVLWVEVKVHLILYKIKSLYIFQPQKKEKKNQNQIGHIY